MRKRNNKIAADTVKNAEEKIQQGFSRLNRQPLPQSNQPHAALAVSSLLVSSALSMFVPVLVLVTAQVTPAYSPFRAAAWFCLQAGVGFCTSTVTASRGFDRFIRYAFLTAANLVVTAMLYAHCSSQHAQPDITGAVCRALAASSPEDAFLAVAVGVVGVVLWVAIGTLLDRKVGKQGEAYYGGWNPYISYGRSRAAQAILAVRLFNSSTMVALWEELYSRGFIYRALVSVLDGKGWQHFYEVPVGRIHPVAIAVEAALFGLQHIRTQAEVLAGVLFALLMHALRWHTQSLVAPIIAHGVTNCLLWLYAVKREEWVWL